MFHILKLSYLKTLRTRQAGQSLNSHDSLHINALYIFQQIQNPSAAHFLFKSPTFIKAVVKFL